MLIRLAGVAAGRKAEVVATVFRERGDVLPGSFTVITPGAVKVRGRG